MPGACSLEVDPTLLANHPENVQIWFPSTLPSASRDTQCAKGLPRLEYRLRFAQAMDALNDIRLSHQLIQVLATKSQSHLTTSQRPGTRTRIMFDRARAKLAGAVSTYRAARKAIVSLAPKEEFGAWQDTVRDLNDDDIRGPGHEESETSRSRSVRSWIWTTATRTSTSAEDPDLNAALRVEWSKTEEQAKRYEEEIELVVEEMRRTLVTFESNARKWDERAASPSFPDLVEAVTVAGIAAYARKQADIHRKLINVFLGDWYEVLKEQPLAASWLSEYPRPPANQRHRLVSNVRLYHSTSPAPHGDTSNIDNAPPGDADMVSPGPSLVNIQIPR